MVRGFWRAALICAALLSGTSLASAQSAGRALFFAAADSSGLSYRFHAEITADGTLTQTAAMTGLSPGSIFHVTDNYLLSYQPQSGNYSFDTLPSSAQNQGAFGGGGTTSSGYAVIASVGDQLMLYNPTTHAYETGVLQNIPYNGGPAIDSAYYRKSTGFLHYHYDLVVANNGHLIWYNQTTGDTLIGYFSQAHAWVATQALKLTPGLTQLLSLGQFVALYDTKLGTGPIGYISQQAKFVQTGTLGGFGSNFLMTMTQR